MSSPIVFDRATGHFEGAGVVDMLAARALQAGSKASALYHHRGFSVGCRALRPVIGDRDIVVQLNEDARFAFPFGDGYWSLLLDRSYDYEASVNRVFLSIADADHALIDCGANFGFWSVLASSRAYGSHAVLAVEPSSANFGRLARNAELNGGRFKALRRAIGSVGGTAWLSGDKHEAFTLADPTRPGESVEVVTLDDLLDDETVAQRQRIVVKLDVEGMEIAAIKGGAKLLDRETLLIVEDHGADRHHTVSRFIQEETPYRIFVLDPRHDRFTLLSDIATLDRIKEHTSIGYNVFATNSPFWERRLRRILPRVLRSA